MSHAVSEMPLAFCRLFHALMEVDLKAEVGADFHSVFLL
jgi:hypothetical protein